MPLTRLSKGLVESDLILEPFRNLIINGSMDHWQRGESFSEPYGYVADRWGFHNNTADATIAKGSGDGPAPGVDYLRMTVAVASTGVDSQFAYVWQPIEGYVARKIASRNFSISFWIRSSVVGTFVVSMRTGSVEYNYCLPVTINQANTWEYKTLENIPMLSDALSQTYDSLRAAIVGFNFCCGANLQSSATGQWVAGNKIGLSGQSDFFATIGNTIDITQVQIEPGRICTPFEDRHTGLELDLCRRYYEHWQHDDIGWVGFENTLSYSSWTTYFGFYPKRAVPTMMLVGFCAYRRSGSVFAFTVDMTDVLFNNVSKNRSSFTLLFNGVTSPALTTTANTPAYLRLNNADAYLYADAEL